MILFRYKKLLFFISLSLITATIFYACKTQPEQPIAAAGKKATLVLEVMHHQWTIPNIPVYLKKGATEFPGEDTSLYDFSLVTNQSGNAVFSDLLYGNYFLFVHGWDPVFNDTVIGYKPVVINDSSSAGGIVDDHIFVSE